ncbi:M81 family metallopeptidase [Peribacillus sp. SCS-26]|uniref:M81 family metallopeptidase n=1 Tax=Paraperibacillus marinus TaxID=3115295 RepID=UPI0039059476
MEKLRIGIAFFYHESNSFAPYKTVLQDFYNEGYFKGNELLSAYEGTGTEAGGFIEILRKEEGVEMVPLLAAAAVPSGPVAEEAFQHIAAEMISCLQEAGRLDGLLIALHGAMAAEVTLDPEEVLLRKIRVCIGPQPVIAATLDMHANLSREMIKHTPYFFGFKTYPHTDMYQQGMNAAIRLLKVLRENRRAEAVFIKLPMMPPSINMKTSEGPMHELMELASMMEAEGEAEIVSIFGGFPYSDVPCAGASIIAVDQQIEKANKAAQKAADRFWKLREQFIVELPGVEEGLNMALSIQDNKPVAVADISDNPLSCGSGDTTALLREMLCLNLERSLFGGLTDPVSIQKCRQAGEGAVVSLELGGKMLPQFGPPVPVTAKVIALSKGIFYNSGPFNHKLKVDLKGAAFIRAGNMDILLIGRPMSANDPEMFRHIGIEPSAYRIMVLKAKNHFLAAFGPIISTVIYVDAPGVAANDLSVLNYTNISKNLWPLSQAEWPPKGGSL